MGVLYTVSTLYKHYVIDYKIFRFFFFQDPNVLTAVAKNYQNRKLQVLLDKLLDDREIMKISDSFDKPFRRGILELKSGDYWEGGKYSLKSVSKIHLPILDTLKVGL